MACTPDCATCALLRRAALSLVGDGGLEAMTLEALASSAAIDAVELRSHYATGAECLYDTYEEVARDVRNVIAAALTEAPSWPEALTLVGKRLLARMAERPAEAQLCFIEVLRGDREMLRRRNAERQRTIDLFVREHRRRRHHEDLPELQLELLVSAGFRAIGAAVADGRGAALPELEPELASLAEVFEPVAG